MPDSKRSTPTRPNGRAHENVIVTGASAFGASAFAPEMLAALGFTPPPKTMISDDDIQRHEGSAILLPEDMGAERARDILDLKIKEENTEHEFNRVFDYLPHDGANATANVLARMFGITVGKRAPGGGPFGPPPSPPGSLTIKVGHNETRDVPYGRVTLPSLPGTTLELTGTHGEFGPKFAVSVTTPKKNKREITALFDAIEEELRTASIYRGKPLHGAHELEFLDPTRFDPASLVFSEQVEADLDAALWAPIQHPDAVRRMGMTFRRSVLLYGTYGTGKTSIGEKASWLCARMGVTYLVAKAGRDDLRTAMNIAARYAPAVVFIEDIDAHIPADDDKSGMSEVLDLFDGVTAKGRDVIVVGTTNEIDDIPASVLRPGRMDYVIPIEGIDRSSAERIIRVNVPDTVLGDVDFDAVYAEMAGFQPAFGKAVATRALSAAVSRTRGAAEFRLTTEDLVTAARSLQAQLRLMEAAAGDTPRPAVDTVLRDLVEKAVDGMRIVDSIGDPVSDDWHLSTRR